MSRRWQLRRATLDDAAGWGPLRRALWPDEGEVGSEADLATALREGATVFLAIGSDGAPVGFAEAALRHDHVNGTATSPVGFLEAWYVDPAWRRQGVGQSLLEEVAAWTRAQGCSELASDALLDNPASHAAHLACGFAETERVVYFRMPLEAS